MRRILSALGAVLVIACSTSSTTQPPPAFSHGGLLSITGSYALSATSSVIRTPTTDVQIALTIRNTGTRPDSVEQGGCWSIVQLYAGGVIHGAPAFNQDTVPYACTVPLGHIVVAPGDSATLSARALLTTPQALAGTYAVQVWVAPSGALVSVPAGTVQLP